MLLDLDDTVGILAICVTPDLKVGVAGKESAVTVFDVLERQHGANAAGIADRHGYWSDKIDQTSFDSRIDVLDFDPRPVSRRYLPDHFCVGHVGPPDAFLEIGN